jgi:hypothetical protein
VGAEARPDVVGLATAFVPSTTGAFGPHCWTFPCVLECTIATVYVCGRFQLVLSSDASGPAPWRSVVGFPAYVLNWNW